METTTRTRNVTLRESYGDYCARMADEIAREHGWTEDDDDDPLDTPPAAPAALPVLPANVTPLFACPTCQDSGRVLKPSAFFRGKLTEGFCPDCTPHIDVRTGRYHRPAAA